MVEMVLNWWMWGGRSLRRPRAKYDCILYDFRFRIRRCKLDKFSSPLALNIDDCPVGALYFLHEDLQYYEPAFRVGKMKLSRAILLVLVEQDSEVIAEGQYGHPVRRFNRCLRFLGD